MRIEKEEIKKLADLARIELSEEELGTFSEQLSSILDYAKQVQEVDTSEVNSGSHISYDVEQFRDDKPQSPKVADDIVQQFPERAGKLNKVKSITETNEE